MNILKFVFFLTFQNKKYLFFENTSSVLIIERSQVRETAHRFVVLNGGTFNMHQNFDDLWNFQRSKIILNY